ncbi:heparinase II/III family protein [Candidatus Thioglobus sp.]|nr:heparinase II/III family protein [Candidatus Thioglobus sp.]
MNNFKKTFIFLNTVKYLKISQIISRVKLQYRRITPDLASAPRISIPVNEFQTVVQSQPKMLSESRFRFLNLSSDITKAEDWNLPNKDKLWLYNLHYFDDLTSLEFSQRVNWHRKSIQRWVDENPPGFGVGWEAYPSSMRIVNWIKWFLLGDNLRREWLDSLAIQARYLSNNLETHLLGNHLFANAKALMFAGIYFQGTEADNWYQIGLKIIEKELLEQVLADGGNFELSPMYHSIFLEDLLDIVNIHNAYNKELPKNIMKKILPMFDWMQAMSHPDGDISFFNDATLGIAPSLKNLLDYAKRLGIIHMGGELNTYTHLKASGYIRVQRDNMVSIIDTANIGADYIPGHGHADTLSFELSLFEQRVIVNSGISVYGNSAERQRQRGTDAHSTVVIDNQNSSEVWDGFRVARRAQVDEISIENREEQIKLSACHDGYKRLKGSPKHCREWNFYKNSLVITDKIIGTGKHGVQSILHIHPNAKLMEINNQSVNFQINKKIVNIELQSNGKLEIVPSTYHPEFGLSIENKKIIINYNDFLPFEAIFKVSW